MRTRWLQHYEELSSPWIGIYIVIPFSFFKKRLFLIGISATNRLSTEYEVSLRSFLMKNVWSFNEAEKPNCCISRAIFTAGQCQFPFDWKLDSCGIHMCCISTEAMFSTSTQYKINRNIMSWTKRPLPMTRSYWVLSPSMSSWFRKWRSFVEMHFD